MKKCFKSASVGSLFIILNLAMILPAFPGPLPLEDSLKRVDADIRFLTDELLEGRRTPSRGLDAAAIYCANQLKLAGWQPAGNSGFFQTYSVKSFSGANASYTVSLNGINLEPKDFIFLPIGIDPQSTPVKYNLEFAGFGIFAPDKGVDDYGGIDVRNKAAIAFLGAPWKMSDSFRSYDRIVGKNMQVAIHGGTFLVYVSEEFEPPADAPASQEVTLVRQMSGMLYTFNPEFKGKPAAELVPTLIITPRVFNKVLGKAFGGTYEETKRKLLAQEPIQYNSKAFVKIQVNAQTEEGKASNIAAILPGTDPVLKDEWIVLTAHYDHPGSFGVLSGGNGIFGGMRDSAADTAVLLETARQLAAKKLLKRSVLMLLTSGKESGMLGSSYYAKHPLIPYDRLIADINVDGVELLQDDLLTSSMGTDELFLKTDNICRQIQMTANQSDDPRSRDVYYSDSYSFARFNVPFIQFSTGGNPGQPQPAGETKSNRFEKTPKMVIVIYYLLKELGQEDKKPAFRRPKWFLTPVE